MNLIFFNPYNKFDMGKINNFLQGFPCRKLNKQEDYFLYYREIILREGYLTLQRRNLTGKEFPIRFNSVEELETLYMKGYLVYLGISSGDTERIYSEEIYPYFEKLNKNFYDAEIDEVLAMSFDDIVEEVENKEKEVEEKKRLRSLKASEIGKRNKNKRAYYYKMVESENRFSKERKEVNRIIRNLKKEGRY